MEPEGSVPYSQQPANSESLYNISLTICFYAEECVAPRPTPKLEDHNVLHER
jgi:hypothetical protein